MIELKDYQDIAIEDLKKSVNQLLESSESVCL